MTTEQCFDHNTLTRFSSGLPTPDPWDHVAGHVIHCRTCQAVLDTIVVRAGGSTLRIQRQTSGHQSYLDEPECRQSVEDCEQIVPEWTRRSDGLPTLAADGPIPPGTSWYSADEYSVDGDNRLPCSQAVGVYRLESLIGRGGMGVVYRAVHTKLDRPVALKVLTAQGVSARELVRRFQREMRAIGRLDHPHLVRATDAGAAGGVHFLVMELLEGTDLASLVRRDGPLPLSHACELIRQAAVGLNYVHEQGLVHRDIKPSNLMLLQDARVKILDLGLALLMEKREGSQATRYGTVMGTADYIAPEQVNDSRQVDRRADLYSLGCTLYYLLYGQPPFSSERYDTPLKKFLAHANAPLPAFRDWRADVPEELCRLLERLLAKHAADRPATASEVAAALEPFAARADLERLAAPPTAAGVEKPRPSAATQAALHGRPLRRRRAWLTLAAVGTLTCLTLMVGILAINRDKDGRGEAGVPLPVDGVVSVVSEFPSTTPPTASSIALVVSNTNDRGPGSLRQAIEDANARSGPETIVFRIPTTDRNFVDVDSHLAGGDAGRDAFVIRPQSPFPELTDARTTIDGRTQTAFTGDTNPRGPEIVLDGGNCSGSASCIRIAADLSRIFGLNIQGFAVAAIEIRRADGNWIAENYIGTDATGMTARGNGHGIQISNGASNIIGTHADAVEHTERNIISGNRGQGVGITGIKANGNSITGNFIGTDRAGIGAIGNGIGVLISNGVQRTAVRHNLVTGNDGYGIHLRGGWDERDFWLFTWPKEDGGNGHSYLVTPPMSWLDAEAFAVAKGTHLVTINSMEEQQFLDSTLFGNEKLRNDNFWIGLTDKDQEGVFIWASGEPDTYENWLSGQPDNGLQFSEENFVAMRWTRGTGVNGGRPRSEWGDQAAYRVYRGIVEFCASPDQPQLQQLTATCDNHITGNRFEVPRDGKPPLRNGGQGVKIDADAPDNIVERDSSAG